MFASSKSLCKIGNLHKRALRFMLDDNSGSYERILKKSGKFSMNTKTKHKLCIEIYNFNPSFMKKRLSSMPVRQQHKLNLNIPKNRQVTFGTKSLESLGPKIWSNLSYHIKSTKNLNVFENLVKKWIGSSCSCNVCLLDIYVQYCSVDIFCVIFVNFLLDPEFHST